MVYRLTQVKVWQMMLLNFRHTVSKMVLTQDLNQDLYNIHKNPSHTTKTRVLHGQI